MAKTIDEILDACRMHQGKISRQPHLVNGVKRMMTYLAEKKPKNLRLSAARLLAELNKGHDVTISSNSWREYLKKVNPEMYAKYFASGR